jgi:NADPH:quinone reductase-like Zn-dependent oxidoreductase
MTSIPVRMRAAVSRRYGKPEVVHLEEIATPSPAAGQILVRVRATTLNRTDCGYRGGTPFIIRFWGGLRRPKSPAWGTEFAGDVVALGEGATRFAVGDRIAGWVDGTFGAHAEYLVVKETRLIVPIPPGRSHGSARASKGAVLAQGARPRSVRVTCWWRHRCHWQRRGATGRDLAWSLGTAPPHLDGSSDSA